MTPEIRACKPDLLAAIHQLEKQKGELETEIETYRKEIVSLKSKIETKYIAFKGLLNTATKQGDKPMEIITGCITVLRELHKNPALDLSKFNITGCSYDQKKSCLSNPKDVKDLKREVK